MGPNGDPPDTRTNGCWAVETGQFRISDLATPRRLGGDGSVSNDYLLLTPAESDSPPCAPDGTYSYTDTVRIGGGDRAVRLAFELVVTDGHIDRLRNPAVSPVEPR